MTKTLMTVGLTLALATTAGCAGSFNRMRTAVTTAPDWYKDSRTEIIGRGYPKIADVPTVAPLGADDGGLKLEREDLGAAELAFLSSPRAQPATVSTEDMIAWRDDALDEFAPVEEPVELLTLEEVEAMRALFRPYTPSG